MRARGALFGLVLVATLAAERHALACIDAGPPNGTCNDGGAAWIDCTSHADCPSPQLCFEGTCSCITSCPFGERAAKSGGTVCSDLPQGCKYDEMGCHVRGGLSVYECPSASCSLEEPGNGGLGFSLVLVGLVVHAVVRRLVKTKTPPSQDGTTAPP